MKKRWLFGFAITVMVAFWFSGCSSEQSESPLESTFSIPTETSKHLEKEKEEKVPLNVVFYDDAKDGFKNPDGTSNKEVILAWYKQSQVAVKENPQLGGRPNFTEEGK